MIDIIPDIGSSAIFAGDVQKFPHQFTTPEIRSLMNTIVSPDNRSLALINGPHNALCTDMMVFHLNANNDDNNVIKMYIIYYTNNLHNSPI